MKKNTSEFVARNNLVVDPRWQSPGARDRPLPAEHAEELACARVRVNRTSAQERVDGCGWLWRAMRPGSKFNRLASRWLGVMTTHAAGSTSANWGQPCQTTAIGCWETNVVVLATLPSTDDESFAPRNGREEACESSPLTASPAPVANFDCVIENNSPTKCKNYIRGCSSNQLKREFFVIYLTTYVPDKRPNTMLVILYGINISKLQNKIVDTKLKLEYLTDWSISK